MEIKQILECYPKKRPILQEEYVRIFEKEYIINREGTSFCTRISAFLEKWMHITVAQYESDSTLEIGAGTLNHLKFERGRNQAYDIIEPFAKLYKNKADLAHTRNIYNSINDVPLEQKYNRIISIAVLEHLLDLPMDIARSAILCNPAGIFQAAIPCEGELMWYLAWRLGTGMGFKIRTGLDYKYIMEYEHVNSLREIYSIVNFFFNKVTIVRYPIKIKHLSFYAYIEAQEPKTAIANNFVSSRCGL